MQWRSFLGVFLGSVVLASAYAEHSGDAAKTVHYISCQTGGDFVCCSNGWQKSKKLGLTGKLPKICQPYVAVCDKAGGQLYTKRSLQDSTSHCNVEGNLGACLVAKTSCRAS